MTDATEKSGADQRRRHGRSPSYPSISLPKAIAKAQALYDAEGKYAIPMPSAFAAWGYGAKSSGGRETRAALKYFSLITVEGDGEAGKVKLSEDALRVLLDKREDQSEKKALLKRMAIAPAVHKAMLDRFPDGIKSDATVEHFLVFELGFNEDAAKEVVSEFKETAEFTDLFQPDTQSDKISISPSIPMVKVSVGDLVQAEVAGSLAFPSPVRVRAIQSKDGIDWVFVDGYEAAVRMDQVQLATKGPTDQPTKPAVETPRMPVDAPPTEWREELLLDEAGDEIFIRYKGDPSQQRYEFIRDYLDFKLKRMKRATERDDS